MSKDKGSSKRGILAVGSLILGLLSLIALIVLIVICPEIYHRDDAFLCFCICIAAVSAISILMFIFSKKNKLAVVSVVIAGITLLGLGFYSLLFIPKKIKYIEKSFMMELEHVGLNPDTDFYMRKNEVYPYGSIFHFLVREKASYREFEYYLDDLYDDGEYAEWVAACEFLCSTSGNDVLDRSFLEDLWEHATVTDPYSLTGYSCLYENSDFARNVLNCEGVNRMKSDMDALMTDGNMGNGIYMLFGEADSFRVYNGLLIWSDGDGYIVVDLDRGNYFYNGSLFW